ncbi:MAG: methyltransferase domain-containing protein [Planctomycetota bacterium]
MLPSQRPSWRLPRGVSRGTWDYVQSRRVARDYDDYFAWKSLFQFDQEVLVRHFSSQGLVADFGCGTGRALLPLVRNGRRGLAIDLSRHMLQVVLEKAASDGVSVDCLQANLVDMDAIADASVDDAMCLFSTLGMIRGRTNRRRALGHFYRILKPGGRFVLHVHNYWYNLRDPGGPRWLMANLAAAPFRSEIELGDKWFPYRGLPSMYLHVFRWRELASDLRHAGFRIVEKIALDARRRHPLAMPWFLGALRANGWIIVVAK